MKTQTSGQQGEHVIVPFAHVDNIMPGVTTRSQIENRLGSPDRVETRQEPTLAEVLPPDTRIGQRLHDKVVEIWNDSPPTPYQILYFGSQGLQFFCRVPSERVSDPVIETICVEAPYSGKSPNGLFLGMERETAIQIIKRDYYIDPELSIEGNVLSIAREKDAETSFQVWFSACKLTRMRLDQDIQHPAAGYGSQARRT